MVGYWSKMIGFGPRWSDLVQDGRIWSKIVGFGPNWSDLVQNGHIWLQKWSTKVKKHIVPELTQKGLETVPIAPGSPGNRFL